LQAVAVGMGRAGRRQRQRRAVGNLRFGRQMKEKLKVGLVYLICGLNDLPRYPILSLQNLNQISLDLQYMKFSLSKSQNYYINQKKEKLWTIDFYHNLMVEIKKSVTIK
jgi:hypothetical protein